MKSQVEDETFHFQYIKWKQLDASTELKTSCTIASLSFYSLRTRHTRMALADEVADTIRTFGLQDRHGHGITWGRVQF